jgi:hypothetical protein
MFAGNTNIIFELYCKDLCTNSDSWGLNEDVDIVGLDKQSSESFK